MTTETKSRPMWQRLAVPLLGGAIAGGLASFAFLNFAELGGTEGLGSSREIGGLVGVMYALPGLSVLIGALSPSAGAKFLNVEDADELREQRRMLTYSSVAMLMLGGALVLLAISGEGAFVPAEVGAVGSIGLIVVSVFLSGAMRRHTDELQRALSSDATITAFYLLLLFGGGWSILAHLDFLAGPAPLDWLTMFAAMLLIGAFWQTARRGLLNRGPN